MNITVSRGAKKYRQTGRNQPVTVSKDDSILYRQSSRLSGTNNAKNETMGSRRLLAPSGIAMVPTSEYSPKYRRERPHSTSSLGKKYYAPFFKGKKNNRFGDVFEEVRLLSAVLASHANKISDHHNSREKNVHHPRTCIDDLLVEYFIISASVVWSVLAAHLFAYTHVQCNNRAFSFRMFVFTRYSWSFLVQARALFIFS